jgi:hypothetical protein
MISMLVRVSRLPGGLVGEDQGRRVHERAGNGDALLLSAGELARLMVGAVGQPHRLQGPARARVALDGR